MAGDSHRRCHYPQERSLGRSPVPVPGNDKVSKNLKTEDLLSLHLVDPSSSVLLSSSLVSLPPPAQTVAGTPTRRKRVCFNLRETQNYRDAAAVWRHEQQQPQYQHRSNNHHVINNRDLWYLGGEIQEFKQRRKQDILVAQTLFAADVRFANLVKMLQGMHQDCLEFGCHYNGQEEDFEELSQLLWKRHGSPSTNYNNNNNNLALINNTHKNKNSKDTTAEQEKEEQWLDSILGLEIFVCGDSFVSEHKARKVSIQRVVWEMQDTERLPSAQRCRSDGCEDEYDFLDEELRDSCREYSQTAQLWAQLLAHIIHQIVL